MGRISGRDAIKKYRQKYSGGGIDFFRLKDDGDHALVRFLHKNDEDLPLFLVHEIEIDGKNKFIECLEDGCPFCESGDAPKLKLFISVYEYDTYDEVKSCFKEGSLAGSVKIWDRGPAMIDTLIAFIDKKGNLDNRDYEIQRKGAKGDKKTQYILWPADDKISMEDRFGEEIPEPADYYKSYIKQMTAEEMTTVIKSNEGIARHRTGGADDEF